MTLLWTVLLFATFTGPAYAADDVTIQLSIDRAKIGIDETAVLTLSVSNASQQQLPEPNLPPLPQFDIYSAGSSTNLTITNGVSEYSQSYNYVLSPKKVGTFPIRSAWIVVGNKRIASNELNLVVVGTAEQAAGPIGQEGSDDKGTAKDIFLYAEVANKDTYVDEQVTLIVKLCRAISTLSQPDYTPPHTPDFWSNDIPPQKQYYQVLNGRRYFINEIRTALFPTKPGKLKIGTARVSVTVPERSRRRNRDPFSLFDNFFQQGKNVTVKSKPITVNVKTLPMEGKTAQFSGGVGSYKISSMVDKTEVEVNEAITMTVKIRGTGNIKSIPEPTIPELDGFRIEKSSSDFKMSNVGLEMGGTKTFEYILIPRLPGYHQVKPITLNFFDPKKKKYFTAETRPVDLIVKQGEVISTSDIPYNMVSGQTINLNEKDIRYIITENSKLTPRGRILLNSPGFLTALALPLVVMLGGMIDIRRKRRLTKDVAYARLKRANAMARKRLKKAEEYLNGNDDSAFYAELSGVAYRYIADKFNLSAHGLTSDTVHEILKKHDVSEQLQNDTLAILSQADFGRFAGGAGKENSRKELFEKAKKVIVSLEDVL
jgi:hypothetical protein